MMIAGAQKAEEQVLAVLAAVPKLKSLNGIRAVKGFFAAFGAVVETLVDGPAGHNIRK
jgi:hypothetical protein